MKPVLNPQASEMQNRPIVLIGLMGVGKTTVGRRLAQVMERPFADADEEIEKSAGRSVTDIFDDFGEQAFRDGEYKVILRLLQGQPCILATGGGAYMNPKTRAAIRKHGTSVWLRAGLDELVHRTARRDTRPLLRQGNPEQILQRLIKERHPVYAKADLVIDSDAGPHANTVNAILQALAKHQLAE
ncbi:Shikimate kinase I [hydrothermal vent metagenome]|uniref:Shikimate kinase I n=1 Tax=hydrothermal vent metagenome TaxID=652676 RepID=A0A3B0RLM5_9ZZZZ